MIEWMLTFILVANVNGKPVETPRMLHTSTAEQCIGLLMVQRETLPRNHVIRDPQCREVRRI